MKADKKGYNFLSFFIFTGKLPLKDQGNEDKNLFSFGDRRYHAFFPPAFPDLCKGRRGLFDHQHLYSFTLLTL
jgi:hypothetical protein